MGRAGPARLGRRATPTRSAQACVALLSDWFPATTGEIVHVDGGFHAIGGLGRRRRGPSAVRGSSGLATRELVEDRRPDRGGHLVERSSSAPERMAAASSASSATPSAASRAAWASACAGPERQLPLDHGQDVDRDPGVELHPPLGRRHDVALEELPHRLDELRRGRDVVRCPVVAHGSSSEQVVLASRTPAGRWRPARPSGSTPDQVGDACMMHMIPHLSVPSISHHRSASRSTGGPDAAS